MDEAHGAHPFGILQNHISHMMQVGISIESLDTIAQQTCASGAEPSKAPSFQEFCQKMLENFFNYASSFAVTPSQIPAGMSETFVPASTLQNWFSNFQRRLAQNPNFWK